MLLVEIINDGKLVWSHDVRGRVRLNRTQDFISGSLETLAGLGVGRAVLVVLDDAESLFDRHLIPRGICHGDDRDVVFDRLRLAVAGVGSSKKF